MSHELRTPLNAIIGYSEMLIEDAEALGQHATLADLRKIHGAGKHLLTLINDILDLSKIEAGKMGLYLETFDVSRLLEEVRCTVQPAASHNANTLDVSVGANVGLMHADLTKVRQSLLNLLSNACKFTTQGRITLQVTRETGEGHEWCVFHVHDTGIGMTAEQVGQLFQDFVQVDASTTRRWHGVRTRHQPALLPDDGGDISATSTMGQGSTFTIRLPMEVRERGSTHGSAGEEARPHAAPPHGGHTARSGPILVADDNPAHSIEHNLSHENLRQKPLQRGPHIPCDPRSRAQWFYRNTHLLHRRFPEAALVCGRTGDMLILGQTHAVGTTDTTARRVLRRGVARQRDRHGHLLTEAQQAQRIVGRNHGQEAGGDRIAILDRFREEPRPQRQRKAVPIAYQETPAPIDTTDLLGQRLW